MGQKVNPIGFRTGVMVGWKSRWYASKQEFADLLIEDRKIRGISSRTILQIAVSQRRDRSH